MSGSISSNALSLLTIYGSDSSDDEVPGPRVSTKRTRKDDDDKPSKRLPRPDLFLNTTCPDHIDDPSLHDGRIRSFSHERGNWATFIYIPFLEREGIEELILATMQVVPKHIGLRKTEELHISLTKTVILKHHWIESFVESVKSRTCFKKFMILFNDLKVYCNEERTRTFIGLCIRTGYDSLVSLVKVMDECLAEFNLPLFYNNPSFHMSIAWCVGDYEDELNSILPQLNYKLQELMETEFDAEYEYSLGRNNQQKPGPSNVSAVSPCLSSVPVMPVSSITNTLFYPEAIKSKKVVIGHRMNRRPLLVEVNNSQTVDNFPRATDTRYFSKEFMTEFIRVYKQHPSLWKIKSKEYTNKNLKNVGIIKLIEVCKQFNVMEANKDFVLKKIQSIRGSFRKENKKVKDSQRNAASVEDIYIPTLWYFDLLKFTLDQETSTEDILHFESASSENSDSSDGSQDHSDISQVMEMNFSQNEEEQVKPFQLPTITRKRAKMSNNTTDNESTIMFMKACTDALSTKNKIIDEFHAVGMNVSAKLKKMKPKQQAYAEFLIQKVLTWGALEKLTENTDLIKDHSIYSPNQYSSVSSGTHHDDDDD